MNAMRGLFVWALVLLCTSWVGWGAEAQAPSREEQQYLLSVLPLIDKGQLAVAEEKLVEGRKVYPRSAIIQNALGIVYLRQNKIEAAAAAFQHALEILPSFTAAQLHLASIYQQQGEKKKAADLFAGVAGSLLAHFTAFLSPTTFQFTTSFYLIIMIVVGGLGSIEGAILGAILITVILEVFREFGAFRFVNFAVLLVLIMLYRPQGIIGGGSVFRKRAA